MNILITGATGQDGSNMVDYLLSATEYNIYGSYRRLSVSNHTNLEHIQNKYKKDVEIGSYPFFRLGKIGVSVVSRSNNINKLKKVSKDLKILAKDKKIKIFKL